MKYVLLFYFIWYFLGSNSESQDKSLLATENNALFHLHTITDGRATNSIHRFFDTSPIDPNMQYLAITELPRPPSRDMLANITVFDLQIGTREVIDQTMAWGSQLGAQVQWSQSNLFYNTLIFNHSDQLYYIRGVKYDIFQRSKVFLPCSVYHVSSDGTKSISPDLTQIINTQKGYGVDWRSVQLHTTFETGIFRNDFYRQTCTQLYSLKEIASIAGIDITRSPTYGFHTKWSSDGQYILFVLRTIERGVKESFLRPRPRVRVQHLFILSDPFIASGTRRILYLFSWASKPFLSPSCINVSNCTNIIVLRDGNHPNWLPDSLKVSLNLEVSLPSFAQLQKRNRQKRMSTVVLDLTTLLERSYRERIYFPLFHQAFAFHWLPFHQHCTDFMSFPPPGLQDHFSTNGLQLLVVWPYGSGHPSIDVSGRYLLTDKYEKESSHSRSSGRVYAPILLIDLFCQMEYSIYEVMLPALLHSYIKSLVFSLQALVKLEDHRTFQSPLLWFDGKEDRSRRCDLHPAMTKDLTRITFNSLSEQGYRQVSIISLDPAWLNFTAAGRKSSPILSSSKPFIL